MIYSQTNLWQSQLEIQHYFASVKNETSPWGFPHFVCKCQH